MGLRNDASYVLSGPGIIVDVTGGSSSNRPKLVDCCEQAVYSETGLEQVLHVERDGAIGGVRKDAGALMEVVSLLRDPDDIDMSVDDDKATGYDRDRCSGGLRWRMAELSLEIDLGEEGHCGVLTGMAVGGLEAIDLV